MHMPGMMSVAQLRQLTATRNQDFDLAFVDLMTTHHQGAIDMARAQLEHGKDPQLRRMAQEIIGAQEREIATLKEWLAQHPK